MARILEIGYWRGGAARPLISDSGFGPETSESLITFCAKSSLSRILENGSISSLIENSSMRPWVELQDCFDAKRQQTAPKALFQAILHFPL